MKVHCRNAHNWVNTQPQGGSIRQRRSIQRPWREGVHCQRLFHSGPRCGYFEVRPTTETREQEHIDRDEKVDQMLEEICQKQEAMENDRIEPGQKSDAQSWLERVEWARHLAGFHWDTLIPLIALPQEEEPALQRICQSFDRMIDIGQQAAIGGQIPFFARVEVNRKEQGKNPNRPFQARMEEDTKQRYTQVCHRIMGYIYRTYQLDVKPPYEFTHDQRTTWDRLVQSAEEDMPEEEVEEVPNEEDEDAAMMDEDEDEGYQSMIEGPIRIKLPPLRDIDRQCLQFWLAVFDHTLHTDHYHSVLVSALAMLGIDTEDRNWQTPESYTPKLSAVIKLARIMMMLQAYDQTCSPEHSGLMHVLKRMVDRFGLIDRFTPMKWMFLTRTFGLKVRYNTTAGGRIQWERDTVSYPGVKFGMGQFRTWVHGLIHDCREVMMKELLMCDNDEDEKDIPAIPWDQLHDNPSDNHAGYSFIDHPATKLPIDGQKWLFYRVMKDDRRAKKFMRHADGKTWNEVEVTKLMRSIRRFKEKLLVLMHISGGQPARAPELLSIRHHNTKNGGRRNIFVEDGKMVYVTAYHKGYSLGGSAKIIHRYLPREVGELLMYYLWLIQPFQRQIEVAHYGRSFGKGCLWESGPESRQWTSEVVKKLIQNESVIGMGVKLNISSYRQIAIAITRKYLKGEGFVEDKEDEDGLEDGDEDDEPRQRDSVYDLQSGHGSHIAGMIYARAILEVPGEVASMRQQYRVASEAWHQFIQFPSTLGGLKRKRVWDQDDHDVEFRRWRRLRRINVYDQLERLVGPQAQFRGVQEEAIKAITGGQSPILTVMGTGGGKSLLFMLPAACSAVIAGHGEVSMTVVVIPMISLRADLKRRCEAVGITCAEWECRRPRTGVSIMLITPESAVTKSFQAFLIRVKATHQLERIVIDECHVVLDGRPDFRPQLRQLGELVLAETQMVMLTATLPPCEEAEFYRCMAIPPETVTTFRASTTRKNVRYQIQETEGAPTDDQVVQLVRRKLAEHASGKIIVYGTSTRRVQDVAAALACDAYYGDVHDKGKVFERIVGPACRVVVATNALGLGIDIPDIRVVIHMDPPRSLRDFAQESGRAGRDGHVSESIMMVSPSRSNFDPHVSALWKGERCCRIMLDEYLDGRIDRTECEDGEEACYVCERDRDIEDIPQTDEAMEAERAEFTRMTQQRQMIREQMQWMKSTDGLEAETFIRKLRDWNRKCPICYMGGEDGSRVEHRLEECSADGAETVQEVFRHMQTHIIWEKYGACYGCGIPQALCHRFESNGRGRWQWVRGAQCQYPELMVGVVSTVMTLNWHEMGESTLAWMEEEGVNVKDDVQTYTWMGKKIMWGAMEAAMINKVFYRFVTDIG